MNHSSEGTDHSLDRDTALLVIMLKQVRAVHMNINLTTQSALLTLY